MDTTFVNFKKQWEILSSQVITQSYRLNTLKRRDKYVVCCFIKMQHLLYIEKYKTSYKNIRFKISGLTWNEESKLSDRSYPVSDISDYLKYILEKI